MGVWLYPYFNIQDRSNWGFAHARCGRPITKKKIFVTSKYAPLEKYLLDLPESQREVTLRFDQVEGILNNKLPQSAYEDQRWWKHETEGNHVNKRSWSTAGWKIEGLDVNKKWVKFSRAE